MPANVASVGSISIGAGQVKPDAAYLVHGMGGTVLVHAYSMGAIGLGVNRNNCANLT